MPIHRDCGDHRGIMHGSAPRMPKELGVGCAVRRSLLLSAALHGHGLHLSRPTGWSAVENTSTILTVKQVASILRCSKTHVLNAQKGKVRVCRS